MREDPERDDYSSPRGFFCILYSSPRGLLYILYSSPRGFLYILYSSPRDLFYILLFSRPCLPLAPTPIRLGCGNQSGKAAATNPARLWLAIRLGCGKNTRMGRCQGGWVSGTTYLPALPGLKSIIPCESITRPNLRKRKKSTKRYHPEAGESMP